MIETTVSILYFVAVAATAVSIVIAVWAVRAAREVETQMLRFEEATETTLYFGRKSVSASERRLFME